MPPVVRFSITFKGCFDMEDVFDFVLKELSNVSCQYGQSLALFYAPYRGFRVISMTDEKAIRKSCIDGWCWEFVIRGNHIREANHNDVMRYCYGA